MKNQNKNQQGFSCLSVSMIKVVSFIDPWVFVSSEWLPAAPFFVFPFHFCLAMTSLISPTMSPFH